VRGGHRRSITAPLSNGEAGVLPGIFLGCSGVVGISMSEDHAGTGLWRPPPRPSFRMSTWRRGAGGVRSCLPHGARRDRVEAQGLVVSVRPLAGLAQVQEPSSSSSDTTSRRGLGTIMVVKGKQKTFAPVMLAASAPTAAATCVSTASRDAATTARRSVETLRRASPDT
jgi:hypothetical protein